MTELEWELLTMAEEIWSDMDAILADAQVDLEPAETFEQAKADALYDMECERRMGL